MHKIAIIILLVSGLFGCSVLRPVVDVNNEGLNSKVRSDIVTFTAEQNITAHNFFITKARIDLKTKGKNESFLASIKFLYPDTFLISIRSGTGIEAARIFFNKDTVFINDRINRQVLHGRPEIVGRKYGLNPEILPIFLGDYVSGISDTVSKGCESGIITINNSIQGAKIEYVIDCRKGKVISALREGSHGKDDYKFSFERFSKIRNLIYPKEISGESIDMKVYIKIETIEYPWNGSIDFIPGRNYEYIELL